tara:strand:+ start:162 stop:443 length:282 start_codon:yes stop_codon:yes gene_type:complete
MYEFIPHDDDTFAVRVTEGKYDKCEFLIERVSFEPIEDSDEHKFSYDYKILEIGESIEDDEDVDSFVGDLIMTILEDRFSESDGDELILEGGE